MAPVTQDLSDRFHAGKPIGAVAPFIGGSGSGRAKFARAGGRNPAGLAAALARFYEVVEKGE